MSEAVVRDYGDSGLMIEPAGDVDAQWATAQGVAASLVDDPVPGVVDVVASFRHAFVTFDPLTTDHATVRAALAERLAHTQAPAARHTFTIPVVYGGDRGPDLLDVAGELSMTPDEVVALHTQQARTIRFVGSPVAAPFVEIPELPVSLARMRTPRVRVLTGAVSVSGRQSMVYPVPSPGGWRILGQTPLRLFDTSEPGLVPYRPGDLLRFVAIEESAWDDWAGQHLRPDEGGRP